MESSIEPLGVNYTLTFYLCFFEILLLILSEDFVIEVTFSVKHWNQKNDWSLGEQLTLNDWSRGEQ